MLDLLQKHDMLMSKISLDDEDRDNWERLAKLVEEKLKSTNSAMDAIPALFNKWLLTVCQSEGDCNIVKSFLTWAQKQH